MLLNPVSLCISKVCFVLQIVTKALESRDNGLMCVQLLIWLLQDVSMSKPAIASHFE